MVNESLEAVTLYLPTTKADWFPAAAIFKGVPASTEVVTEPVVKVIVCPVVASSLVPAFTDTA
mgnify:CR=1 FL=1